MVHRAPSARPIHNFRSTHVIRLTPALGLLLPAPLPLLAEEDVLLGVLPLPVFPSALADLPDDGVGALAFAVVLFAPPPPPEDGLKKDRMSSGLSMTVVHSFERVPPRWTGDVQVDHNTHV